MSTLIELKRAVSNETEIHVCSSSTSFVNVKLAPKVDIKQLVRDRAQVIKEAKAKGIKVSFKYGTKNMIDDAKAIYDEEYNQYQAKFHLLASLWRSKLNKGIFRGYSDDKDLNAISGLSNGIDSMWNRRTNLSKVNEAFQYIKEVSRRIKDSDFESISI
jgi:hypothetical protein